MLSFVKLKNPIHLKKDRHGHGVEMTVGETRFKDYTITDEHFDLEQSGAALVAVHKITGATYKLPWVDVEVALEQKPRPRTEERPAPATTPPPPPAPAPAPADAKTELQRQMEAGASTRPAATTKTPAAALPQSRKNGARR